MTSRGCRSCVVRNLRDVFGFLALCCGACGDIFDFTEIEQSGRVTVPAGLRIDEVHQYWGVVLGDDLDHNDIDAVRIQTAVVEVVEPEAADLSFVRKMQVFVSAPDLERILVAEQDDFRVGAPQIELELMDVDLKEYALTEVIILEVRFEGDDVPQRMVVEARVVIDVGTNLVGMCDAAL